MRVAIRTGLGTIGENGQFTDVVTYANRKPLKRSGWEAVNYKRKRYQLFGGIRTEPFICLNNPI